MIRADKTYAASKYLATLLVAHMDREIGSTRNERPVRCLNVDPGAVRTNVMDQGFHAEGAGFAMYVAFMRWGYWLAFLFVSAARLDARRGLIECSANTSSGRHGTLGHLTIRHSPWCMLPYSTRVILPMPTSSLDQCSKSGRDGGSDRRSRSGQSTGSNKAAMSQRARWQNASGFGAYGGRTKERRVEMHNDADNSNLYIQHSLIPP